MVMMVSCGPISTLYAMMNETGFWSCASVSKPLEEPVLPEMPFAPPEGDPLVSSSGSSGSSYQAGQMGGYVQRVHVDPKD